MNGNFIVYEQPLNELIRVCLRLEYLFKQIDEHLCYSDRKEISHNTVKLILDLLFVLNRSDLKSKFIKELHRYVTKFSSPGSQQKNIELVSELKELISYFIKTPGKIARQLRENNIIANISNNILSPAGGTDVDIPMYHYWMAHPKIDCFAQIQKWLEEFKEVKQAVFLLLSIIRSDEKSQEVIATKGFYHQTLSYNTPYQLIRVSLPANVQIYPEISAGKHGLSIRFVKPDHENNMIGNRITSDVKFLLTTCVV